MLNRPGRILLAVAASVAALLLVARAVAGFYTEYLWFASEGFAAAFWTRFQADLLVRLTTGAVAAGVVFANLWLGVRQIGPVHVRRRYGNLEIAEQIPRRLVIAGAGLASILAGWWLSSLTFGGGRAMDVVAWLRHVPWGRVDPQFGRDLGFYVFALPVYFQFVDFLILVVVWSAALVLLAYVVVGGVRWRENRIEADEMPRLHFVVLLAVVVLLLAARCWLGRYDLLLEGNGFRGALGYTDVHARLPAHRAMATLSILAAGALLYGAWRRSWLPPVLALGALIIAAIAVGRIYPSLVQRFRVEPNELAREEPYIRWNIEFTRIAYGIADVERRPLPYRRSRIPDWEELAPALSRLPLWDTGPLATVFQQREARAAYYHFPAVEYNRYGAPGSAQQVAVGVREVNEQGIAAEADTWLTRRLNPLYIRGRGAVVTPVADHSSTEPVMWVYNMPVRLHPAAPADLHLAQPDIYFGRSMQGYVVLVPQRDSAFLAEPGRHSPAGIELSSFPRLLALAWRFADMNLLISGDITRDSRLVFRRSVVDRVRAVAPFFLWNLTQPYPVVYDGRIVWILDGFTATSHFPLSRRLQLGQHGAVRYLAHALVAAVDAVSGRIAIYARDVAEPIVATYREIFPELIQPISAMPEGLRAYLRYPATYLSIQAELLKEYYLDRADAFYAGEDYWQVPQDPAASAGVNVPFRPDYAILRLPGEERPEFVATLPFTARERHNMTALLVARSDPPHQGELLLLELPRDQQIPGPSQVDALIEQDPIIAQQFGLWRQTSDVERGRLRIVPLDSGFVFVRPIYLLAQWNPVPELVGIVASDGVRVRMTHRPASLAGSIMALREAGDGPVESPPALANGEPPAPPALRDEWARRAMQLLEEADERLRSGDFAGFGARWGELRELLVRLNQDVP